MGDNGDPIIVCCILGLCCPAAGASQLVALTRLISKARPHLTDLQVHVKAEQVLKRYNYFDAAREIVDGE